MEDRETAQMRKYGESKTTRIMMATVPHVTSGLGLRKFQANGFLLKRVYKDEGEICSCCALLAPVCHTMWHHIPGDPSSNIHHIQNCKPHTDVMLHIS